MDSHTLKVLEYGKVLERLAGHSSNGMGREAALALTPASAPEWVTRALQETREARTILETVSGMPLGGIHDIRESVDRAHVRMLLAPTELLDIAQTVGAARRLKAFLSKRAEDWPLLAEIGGNLPNLPGIESSVEEAISETAEVRDTATPELARIRGQLKVVQSRLREKLNSILRSDKYSAYVQEPVITVREGRFCIPVKAEYRSRFGGIVHDASASGATVFVEPGACVELGNELKELSIKEDQEVHRILTRLTETIGKVSDALRQTLQILASLDLANAKALLALDMQASEPRTNRDGIVRLVSARHPLLPGNVVPIDVEVGDRFEVLLITGPNTGGKTVTLKTVGLLSLMLQSGLQIPASGDSEMAIFDQIFADIGDEQDIQQSLSTFSAHLKNITRIFEALPKDEKRKTKNESPKTKPSSVIRHPSALVLLDEVGAGTDPAEGAALAKAMLNRLREAGARVVATTHYGELKEYAYSTPGVENASVEFDRETLRPTYHVLLGVPGSSHAFYIAGRLGLPESVLEEARGNLSYREQTTGDLLQRIEESRKRAVEIEREAALARQQAEEYRDEYEMRARQVADIQRTVKQQAEEEARTVLRRVSERAENILEELKKMNRGSRRGASARKGLAELRREVGDTLQVEEEAPVEPIPSGGFSFKKGDRVKVISLGLEGELLESPRDGEVPVQMGAMRATLPLDVLRPVTAAPPKPVRKRSSAAEISMRKAIHISPELNLRAMRVDEAAPLLDRYLDDAYAAGINQARLVHGKGTGALRKFVSDYIQGHPVVAAHRLGDETEGGDGVTVVTFKE